MQRIEIELRIELMTPWHAGSGTGGALIERLVLCDVRGRPFLPGSALKGIVREACERLSRTLGLPEPGDPHSKSGRPRRSVVEELFGSPLVEGGLFFRDAAPDEDRDEWLTSASTRTRLQRGLGTVHEKHLFSSETAHPGGLRSVLNGWHGNLWSPDPDYPPLAYALLWAGLLAVERVGGEKSVGRGWCTFSVTRLEWNGRSVSDEDLLTVLEFAPEYSSEEVGE